MVSAKILKEYAKKASLPAKDDEPEWGIDKNVLHNADFNSDDVDVDMLELYAKSIDSVYAEIISMYRT